MCLPLRVLRSTLTLEEDGTAISGAKLIDNRKVKVADITLCIRFNFKLLGGYEGRSQLIHIEDWKDRPKVKLVSRRVVFVLKV